jgi:hypothetical protein
MKRIGIELGDVSVTGALFEDRAPRAVDRLWEALPVSTELRHARRSGNAAYVVAPGMASSDLAVENQVSFCYPGSICLMPSTGTFLLAYGQAQARTEDGNVWVTHLGELEGDTAAFFALLAETQRKGVKQVTITRVED